MENLKVTNYFNQLTITDQMLYYTFIINNLYSLYAQNYLNLITIHNPNISKIMNCFKNIEFYLFQIFFLFRVPWLRNYGLKACLIHTQTFNQIYYGVCGA